MNQRQHIDKKLLRIRKVVDLTGISKSYIYNLCRKGQFPKPIELVPGGTSVAWVEAEVQEWIDSRIQQRDQEV
jgi:prophage regulatory protein